MALVSSVPFAAPVFAKYAICDNKKGKTIANFLAVVVTVLSVPLRRLYLRCLYGVRAIGASVAPVIGAFMASDLSVPVRR